MESTDQLIRITSWNVAGNEPVVGQTLDYLFDDSQRQVNLKPNIQIVGLQEAPQYVMSDSWTVSLTSTLKPRGYILFKRHKLSGILLYIFVLKEILLMARDFETESVKTGFGGLLGNKGGVSLRFNYNGNSFCATNSHLAAHQEKLQQRINDYHTILNNTKFKIDPNTTTALNHDYSFWFGDLNFRLDDIEKHDVLNVITKARTAGSAEARSRELSELYKNDQLTNTRRKFAAFLDFNETLPTFLPTYKFQIGNKGSYDSENRIPAWTDRILYRHYDHSPSMMQVNFKPKLEQLFYDSIFDIDLSDHKPIVSLFRVATYNPNVYNPSPTPYEVVKFEPINGWKTSEDGRLWYKISNELFYRRPKMLSSWDLIAIYKADFGSLEDYLTIVYANNIARISPQLDAQQVAYQSSTPSSRATSRSNSRRGSTSSTSSSSSNVSVGTEAITLNEETKDSASKATTSDKTVPSAAVTPIYVSAIPDDAIIGDGFKYFTATFPDDVLIPGKYVVLYLKNSPANVYNVYGMSEPFEIRSS